MIYQNLRIIYFNESSSWDKAIYIRPKIGQVTIPLHNACIDWLVWSSFANIPVFKVLRLGLIRIDPYEFTFILSNI